MRTFLQDCALAGNTKDESNRQKTTNDINHSMTKKWKTNTPTLSALDAAHFGTFPPPSAVLLQSTGMLSDICFSTASDS